MTPAQKEHKRLEELALAQLEEIKAAIIANREFQDRHPENMAIAGDMGRILENLNEVLS